MNKQLKQECEDFIGHYDPTKGGRFAHNGKLEHNSTWIFTRMQSLLDIISELELERDAFSLHIARRAVRENNNG